MLYRAACREDGVVICIGKDEGQAGDYCSGEGTWQEFTFESWPPMNAQWKAERAAISPIGNFGSSAMKVVNGAIVARTYEEMSAEYGA